jgi:hypothetical protein
MPTSRKRRPPAAPTLQAQVLGLAEDKARSAIVRAEVLASMAAAEPGPINWARADSILEDERIVWASITTLGELLLLAADPVSQARLVSLSVRTSGRLTELARTTRATFDVFAPVMLS